MTICLRPLPILTPYKLVLNTVAWSLFPVDDMSLSAIWIHNPQEKGLGT